MDEYLWNKTGSNPEIEQIEAALKGLAYRPGPPPVLPTKQLEFPAPRRSMFGLSLSFAAGMIAIAAFGSAWILSRNERPATQQAAVKTMTESPVTAIRSEEVAPAVASAPKVSRASRPRRRVPAPKQQMPDRFRPQTLVLTKEEADAYRQLMTALSITSTNLKIVKDKIDGTE